MSPELEKYKLSLQQYLDAEEAGATDDELNEMCDQMDVLWYALSEEDVKEFSGPDAFSVDEAITESLDSMVDEFARRGELLDKALGVCRNWEQDEYDAEVSMRIIMGMLEQEWS